MSGGHAHAAAHADPDVAAAPASAGGVRTDSRGQPPPGGTVVRGVSLAATAAATAYLGLVDPSRGGVYPLCPSRLLLGIDCPACGGLRGTHDLLNGHLGPALNHNLLLPGFIVVLGVVLALWLLPLVGRPVGALTVPRWAKIGTAAIVVAFTVARNVPVASLEFLASS